MPAGRPRISSRPRLGRVFDSGGYEFIRQKAGEFYSHEHRSVLSGQARLGVTFVRRPHNDPPGYQPQGLSSVPCMHPFGRWRGRGRAYLFHFPDRIAQEDPAPTRPGGERLMPCELYPETMPSHGIDIIEETPSSHARRGPVRPCGLEFPDGEAAQHMRRSCASCGFSAHRMCRKARVAHRRTVTQLPAEWNPGVSVFADLST